jgi:septal ring factor EnvC (AmiA/AmiB activator)
MVGCSIDKEHAKPRRRNSSRATSYHRSSMTSSPASQQTLQDEIADLERRLQDAKAQLNQQQGIPIPHTSDNGAGPLSLARSHHTSLTL